MRKKDESVSKFNKTQLAVLKYLSIDRQDHTVEDIKKHTQLNSNHLAQALRFLYENDFVYESILNGKVVYSITPESIGMF